MASSIISTECGFALKEWKEWRQETKLLEALSLVVLVSSTIMVGHYNDVGGSSR